ncbi:MAG: CopD family protein [Gammaproteobacteria bacterium]|nr:CopD family protein [Gammaproteobacteria bacterium]MXX95800.1 CopD family protein [Gammaproteobacteria bacterium]MYF52852.1 CopD family protein [Gammaproteobacteria bacterium]MYK42724.1 CopD family protein [Gammaproteobacteria bacterium]
MLYLKALHLIFAVAWFAALFYLPRLFVYHAEAEDSISIERFKTMERRLHLGILMPSSLLTLVFGLWITSLTWDVLISSLWYWLKLLCILLLFAYQGMCSRFRREFAEDRNTRSAKFFRWFNEVPLVFLIAIIFLAVLKPML